MNENPCRDCSMLHHDKNNGFCLRCKKRVAYVEKLEQDLNYAMSYNDGITCSRLAPFQKIPLSSRMRAVFGR